PMVQPGIADGLPINHFNVLRTIEDMVGLPAAGASADAVPITSIWLIAANTDADTAYLTALYHDVLGRGPDDAGLAAWRTALHAGMPRLDVARGLWESPEHRGQQVDQFFATFLT